MMREMLSGLAFVPLARRRRRGCHGQSFHVGIQLDVWSVYPTRRQGAPYYVSENKGRGMAQ